MFSFDLDGEVIGLVVRERFRFSFAEDIGKLVVL